eukprot:503612-Pelagomonas_calceolata.AAC.1
MPTETCPFLLISPVLLLILLAYRNALGHFFPSPDSPMHESLAQHWKLSGPAHLSPEGSECAQQEQKLMCNKRLMGFSTRAALKPTRARIMWEFNPPLAAEQLDTQNPY